MLLAKNTALNNPKPGFILSVLINKYL